ncbi:MAG TPA: hypothetical protein VFN35_34910 [Ktedonobacteraceae bacterium]|nr:hypothetical protein [Ktedonobacteraceae bacterium]
MRKTIIITGTPPDPGTAIVCLLASEDWSGSATMQGLITIGE